MNAADRFHSLLPNLGASAMEFSREKRVMWLGNVRNIPYRERIELTARAGFGCISTSPMDYDQIRAAGLSDHDIRSIAADCDVRLSYLDPMTSWVPNGLPEHEEEALVRYLRRTPDEFFRIAEALRVDRIHLIGSFPAGRYAVEELIGYYAATCDRAAAYGYKCLIEAMPLWGLKTVDEAWKIVNGANRKNSGIIFDTWHYVRAGRNDALLRQIPSGTFDTVQVADGPLVCPAHHTMAHDCLFHRVPIGLGQVPNLEILKTLSEAGHLETIGPEIFSEDLDRLSGDDIIATIVPGFEALLKGLE